MTELTKHFVEAAIGFLNGELNLEFTEGNLLTPEVRGTSQDINVLVGIIGAVNGQVVYGMPLNLAKSIAAMMLERPVELLDRIAQSALYEFGNIIAGLAVSKFDYRHADSVLKPPSLVAGANIAIATLKLGCSRTVLKSELGNFDVTIALEDNSSLKQPVTA